ncbi:MAG: tetratricopeptide repeat protein [Endomicrobium sp.]|jgi:predicted negative regulator of RcsB-dependent stress response|nr:tetratricopeptide repeat protein [Endomicrobium sp.]
MKKIFYRSCFLIAIVTILTIVVFKLKKNKYENIASKELSIANNEILNGNLNIGISTLNGIILRFPKTLSSYQAKLIKSDILVKENKYKEAINTLNNLLSNCKLKNIKSIAKIRIIYIYDMLKNYDKTILYSKKFIEENNNHFLTKNIYLNLAESYVKIKMKNKAIKTFNEIIVKYPETKEAKISKNRINEINYIN